MKQYNDLVQDIIAHGVPAIPSKGPVLSVFGRTIRFNAKDIPLINERKMYTAGIFGELKAFMNNASTKQKFEEYGCNFWGAWANEDDTLDVDYARLLHNFNGVNQLETLIKGIKDRPDSRKHIISIWDPSSIAKQVPCVLHYQFKVTNNTIDLLWSQRSVDVMLGLASDMISAWAFLHLMAKATGTQVGEVVMQLGDCHIYQEHLSRAGTQLSRDTSFCPKPKWTLMFHDMRNFTFTVSNYEPCAPIKYELKV